MSKVGFTHRLVRALKRRIALYNRALALLPQYKTLLKTPSPRFRLRWKDRWLCLNDATSGTNFDRHYVFHTAWASRILATTLPTEHVDISSSLYFIANVSAFVPIRFYDYRPAELGLSNLLTGQADLCRLTFEDESILSLSCMHVVEHVGLGRYGDPIDYDGDLRAVTELKRVVAKGGQLLFVVPIGGEARIQFNAHRIYTYRQVIEMFTDFKLLEFSLIPDDDSPLGLIRNADERIANAQRYGCGCFWLQKAEI